VKETYIINLGTIIQNPIFFPFIASHDFDGQFHKFPLRCNFHLVVPKKIKRERKYLKEEVHWSELRQLHFNYSVYLYVVDFSLNYYSIKFIKYVINT
jgi:hypothetical protein